MKTLVLDAMGVIYKTGDDVGELLCPFIHENGGLSHDSEIEALYREASLGHLSAHEFWGRVKINPALEDDYLLKHHLSDGLLDFLREARPRFASIWCLSNDVSEWSLKLRERFGLTQHFDGFTISGDVRSRKPSEAIFDQFLEQARVKATDAIFVDDRAVNLDAAASLGFPTVLFGTTGRTPGRHKEAANFSDLLECINRREETRK